jgi:hypothetical protein
VDDYENFNLQDYLSTHWGNFDSELYVSNLACEGQNAKYKYFLAHPMTASYLFKDIYIRACHNYYEGVPVIQISTDNQSLFMDVQNNYRRGHNALYWMDPDGLYAIYENSSLTKYFQDYIRQVKKKHVEIS